MWTMPTTAFSKALDRKGTQSKVNEKFNWICNLYKQCSRASILKCSSFAEKRWGSFSHDTAG